MSVRSWCDGSSDRSFRVDALSYFLFQLVLYDWCNKGRGMFYPVCRMMHIKEPLLLIEKSSPCGGRLFPLSLCEWFFTICLTPYNRYQNVLNASLNKTYTFLPSLGFRAGVSLNIHSFIHSFIHSLGLKSKITPDNYSL